MTKKKTKTMTNTETKTMTKTKTFRGYLQRAILEACVLWDIWSGQWGDMTWPEKRQWQRQWQRQRQWLRQMHLESTFKEQSYRFVTFETFDQGVEEGWPDQKKDNDKDRYEDKYKDNDKDIHRAPSKSDPRDLWPFQHLIRVKRRHDQTNKRHNYNDKCRDKDKYI